MFDQKRYNRLHEICFNSGNYPGYKPQVIESPNGDGAKDAGKRYAHVALKYLRQWIATPFSRFRELYDALFEAHSLAVQVAVDLDVPEAYLPSVEYSALRILEYPPGAGSAPHTDFDLFTLGLYRDDWAPFRALAGSRFEPWDCAGFDVHMGEIGQFVGLGEALRHEVAGTDQTQHAIVYFALPSHSALLPSGLSVGHWLQERLARSRY